MNSWDQRTFYVTGTSRELGAIGTCGPFEVQCRINDDEGHYEAEAMARAHMMDLGHQDIHIQTVKEQL